VAAKLLDSPAMDSFSDKIAVITGGGDGMGRSLAVALAAQGCHLALCDVNEANLDASRTAALAVAPDATRVTTHRCDVSDESQLLAFRDEVTEQHRTDHVDLVFNNAGIGGAGSMIVDERESWERTFNVCWGGVYLGTRTFLPLLMAAEEGHLVNTSSINGLWASIGPNRPHTAYSAAKYAVRGFTEALVTDLRINAPHVFASVVMPGHIGTGIVANSAAVHGRGSEPEVVEGSNMFRAFAPTTADDAAQIILDGVRNKQWRILVGDDAHIVDAMVRAEPERVYERSFVEDLHAQGALVALVSTLED
jgi:NAD(P)-dependent dehydrogenase (short-subunit alcohol dehydrogenase family)